MRAAEFSARVVSRFVLFKISRWPLQAHTVVAWAATPRAGSERQSNTTPPGSLTTARLFPGTAGRWRGRAQIEVGRRRLRLAGLSIRTETIRVFRRRNPVSGGRVSKISAHRFAGKVGVFFFVKPTHRIVPRLFLDLRIRGLNGSVGNDCRFAFAVLGSSGWVGRPIRRR